MSVDLITNREKWALYKRGHWMSISVTSLRKIRDEAFFEVVFEWEDIFAQFFHTQVVQMSPVEYYSRKVYGKLNNFYSIHQELGSDCSIMFVMHPNELRYGILKNIIPIFMDVWTDEQIDMIIDKTRTLKLFYCTSVEVYQRIKNKDNSNKVRYIPLSVSDIYFSNRFSRYRKSIDVIQVGRRNQILHEYMMQFVTEHPEVEYVYTSDIRHNELLEYVSTKRGNMGVIMGREEYVKKLSSAKVSLVSTPAIDGSRKCANGVDFLTPRFYESAVFGCTMIGRYRLNEETKRIQEFCPNILSYEQFSEEMNKALAIGADELYHRTERFITNNLTSCRARQIVADLNELGQKAGEI